MIFWSLQAYGSTYPYEYWVFPSRFIASHFGNFAKSINANRCFSFYIRSLQWLLNVEKLYLAVLRPIMEVPERCHLQGRERLTYETEPYIQGLVYYWWYHRDQKRHPRWLDNIDLYWILQRRWLTELGNLPIILSSGHRKKDSTTAPLARVIFFDQEPTWNLWTM